MPDTLVLVIIPQLIYDGKIAHMHLSPSTIAIVHDLGVTGTQFVLYTYEITQHSATPIVRVLTSQKRVLV